VEDALGRKVGRPFTVPFQPEMLAVVLLEMAQEAGVHMMLQTHFSHVVEPGPEPRGVVVVNKSGPQAVLARSFVDASSEADLAAACGAPCRLNVNSSWGLLMRLGSVDLDRVIETVLALDPDERWPEFDQWLSKTLGRPVEELRQDGYWSGLLDPVKFGHWPGGRTGEGWCREAQDWIRQRWEVEGVFYNLELRIFRRLLKQAVDNGDLRLVKKFEGFGELRLNWDGFAGGGWGPGVVLVNACHTMRGFDATNGEHVSRAEVEARKYCVEIANFLKKYVPGFEQSFLIDMAWQNCPRHVRMIEAEYELTAEDISGPGRDFPDTIYLFPDGRGSAQAHKIPYRILVPKRADNILVAGKCAGGASRARSIPSCMAMGQAAGTAAALMARHGVTNRELDIHLLQTALRENGVILELGT